MTSPHSTIYGSLQPLIYEHSQRPAYYEENDLEITYLHITVDLIPEARIQIHKSEYSVNKNQ